MDKSIYNNRIVNTQGLIRMVWIYFIFQAIIATVFGGWFITDVFNLDGHHGVLKMFYFFAHSTPLLAVIISLTSIIFVNDAMVRISTHLLGFNALLYTYILYRDIMNPPGLNEMMLYLSSVFVVIASFFIYLRLLKNCKKSRKTA